jgi:uncharacterized protein YgbK (DUF1537 family)
MSEPPPDPGSGLVRRWRAEIARDPRRVVVIDDDPTGTQAVSGVPVLLRTGPAALAEFFVSPYRSVFVISNSRALDRTAAVSLVGRIVREVRVAARRAGAGDPAILLRGDSTLRGHVFAETDAVDPALPVLFVPAFLGGGRVTVDGVHQLWVDSRLVPVADTEFARDPVFGYRSRHLADWVREVGGEHRTPVHVPASTLRRDGPAAVAEVLGAAGAGTVVLPDVATEADLTAVAAGLVRAERRGARVVVRCAASLAEVRTGARGRPVDRIPVPAPGRVLVACGSFTDAATRQVAALGGLTRRRREIPETGDLDGVAQRIAEDLDHERRALLTTPRAYRPGVSGALMDRLVSVVRRVRDRVDLLIAKGGITSARLARDALGADLGYVVGQPEPGVVLWRLLGGMPYVVVPGNVGTDQTLARLLSMVDTSLPAPGQPDRSRATRRGL